jgi:hypothetical protein
LIAAAALVLTVGAVSPSVAARNVLSVQASPEFSHEPATVMFVRLDPDDAHRSLLVEVESFNLFRSSLITLDGESAPAAHWIRLKSLPAGHYVVTVTLHRNDGRTATAADSFRVVG